VALGTLKPLSAPDGRVLHVKHLALNRWLLPGGHLEAEDSSLLAAAQRELTEETGIPASAVIPAGGRPDWGRGSVPSLQYSGTRRRSQSLTLKPFRGAQLGNFEGGGP
jgi:8-oxo-dGTP pyrophosphatase MutT (NUDIX family)